MLDLHTHSTASDGTCSPEQIVTAAAALGLTAVALTDHDTMSGLAAFLAAAPPRVRAIPGVEMSCSWYGGTMHILGLFVDAGNPVLEPLLARVRQARAERNILIERKLEDLGLPVSLAEASAVAGGEVVGRPHFAAVLVRKGCCDTMVEAFSRYLASGRPAYVRRFLPLPDEVINAIHAARGLAVWAHPLNKLRDARSRLRQTGQYLRQRGLDAMEVCYSEFTPDDAKLARTMAAELGLLCSGGSDFHGDNAPDIRLGTGRGDLEVPDSFLEPLVRAAAKRAAGGASAPLT